LDIVPINVGDETVKKENFVNLDIPFDFHEPRVPHAKILFRLTFYWSKGEADVHYLTRFCSRAEFDNSCPSKESKGFNRQA